MTYDPTAPLESGCYLDGHRGHYITRDMIELAEGFGYILDPFEAFAVALYDDHTGLTDVEYPFESLIELSDEVLSWLNGGPNEGIDRPIRGQNSPPAIPEDHSWQWFEGDFGLYPDDDDED